MPNCKLCDNNNKRWKNHRSLNKLLITLSRADLERRQITKKKTQTNKKKFPATSTTNVENEGNLTKEKRLLKVTQVNNLPL